MEVIVAYEKHGTFLYSSALALLEARHNDSDWYENWDEGDPHTQWEDRAQTILEKGSEVAAWQFLRERDDFEYESVEKQRVH